VVDATSLVTKKSSGPPDHNSASNTIGKHLQVFVRDNNAEQALKVLKKKMQREGVFREMKHRKAYEKTSDARESRSHPTRAESRPETGSARRSNPDA
jgi:ribosomal protein S21